MASALAFTASAWGVAMAVSPVLQIRRMVSERTSAGVSVGYMAVLFVGFLIWLAYGISIGNVVLIIPNTVAAVVITATIAVALRYRRAVA
ncbi:MAG TPA: SemiSWEET family transporter [Gaiellaceae bacterium]|nr:SemiSWEET family transporter [Gaiellaceae bacterium]